MNVWAGRSLAARCWVIETGSDRGDLAGRAVPALIFGAVLAGARTDRTKGWVGHVGRPARCDQLVVMPDLAARLRGYREERSANRQVGSDR